MRARRDLRHHAPIGCVLRDLTQDLVRQDTAAAVRAGLDDGRSRLVAGGLEAKNAHVGIELENGGNGLR
jgi:hypothetical protein